MNCIYYDSICQSFNISSNGQFNPTISIEEKKFNRGFRLYLGPKITYYKGTGPTSMTPFDQERVGFQADGQLGYVFNPERNRRGNFLGIFASAGMTNFETLAHMFEDQDFVTYPLDVKSNNLYYQIEAGMYIAEFLRVSAGVGRQQFQVIPNGTTETINNGNNNGSGGTSSGSNYTIKNPKAYYTAQYYSGTVGIKIDLGAVDWVVDCQWMFGGNLDNLVARPSTGFLVKF
jgi:hypothetical protein